MNQKQKYLSFSRVREFLGITDKAIGWTVSRRRRRYHLVLCRESMNLKAAGFSGVLLFDTDEVPGVTATLRAF